jgi:hypothetical protein
VLVADWNGHVGGGMVRRYDAAGIQIAAYFVGDALGYECGIGRDRPCFFPWALGLDPDRASVWVADHVSGEIFRFELMSGVLIGQFAGGHCDDFLRPCAVTGMAVVAEPTAATAAAITVPPTTVAAQPSVDR